MIFNFQVASLHSQNSFTLYCPHAHIVVDLSNNWVVFNADIHQLQCQSTFELIHNVALRQNFLRCHVECNYFWVRVLIKSFKDYFEKQRNICLQRSSPDKTRLTLSKELSKMIVQCNVYTFFPESCYQCSILRQAARFQIFFVLFF